MKNRIGRFLKTVCLSSLVVLGAHAQTVYFTDGFEEGLSPEWTQTYFDSETGLWLDRKPEYGTSWRVENNAADGALQYPAGAVVGNGRAYFRMTATPGGHVQTTGSKTRLITPVMNLSMGYQPILRFYHAQAKWTSDFDTLRIYYRKGKSGAWYPIREYTNSIQQWTFEEITLPQVGRDYQIAFEASEHLGHGIVLDSVLVRTKPQITTPHDLTTTDMRDNGVTLSWQASRDADYYRIIVSTTDLDLNVNPDSIESLSIVRDEQVGGRTQSIRLEGLDGGRSYFVQIQSLGEDENSVWCDSYRFRMKAMQAIPYREDFTIVTSSDERADQQLLAWAWGGDYQPFVPLSLGKFEFISPDKSAAVVFPGTNDNTSNDVYNLAIPAGQTSFMATPEMADTMGIADFSLSKCHVTFWGTTYTFQQKNARSITVGVMTDPEDLTTFVPVKTCTVWGYMAFRYFDVDLADYKGDGRYIAFVSDFPNESNWFAIDKVNIELRPLIRPIDPDDIHVVPTVNEASITWPAVEGAVGYEVKYLKLTNKGTALQLDALKMSGSTATASTNELELVRLTARAKYAISVRAVGTGGTYGEWSQPKAFYTSYKNPRIPYVYNFESGTGTDYTDAQHANATCYNLWMTFSNDAVIPNCNKSNARNGNRCLYSSTKPGSEAWTVMPIVDDVTTCEIQFYIRTLVATAGSYLTVGVMVDPSDLSTFVPVMDFTAMGTEYQKCYVNFLSYTGTGRYIAFRFGSLDDSDNTIYMDDVTLQGLSTCFAPALQMEELTDSSVVIRWNKQDPGQKFDLKVNTSTILEAAMERTTGDVFDTTMMLDSVVSLTGLNYARTYYVYIRSVCSEGEDADISEWMMTQFTTDCPESMSLPYICNFDDDVAASGVKPSCWTPAYMTSNQTYPYLTSSSPASPKNSLYMMATATYGSFIAMPDIDADLADVIVRYKVRGTADYQMYLGYMSDPTDYTTFVPVDTFILPGSSTWYEHKSMLRGISGSGLRIAFSTFNGKSNTCYLDDVAVTDITDAPPFDWKAVGSGQDWLEAGWSGKTSDRWEIIVTRHRYPLEWDDSFDPSVIDPSDLVAQTITTANTFKTPNTLEPQTRYYFYGRSTAASDWSLDSLTTECTTWDPSRATSEGFEIGPTATSSLNGTNDTIPNYFKLAQIPMCWTVGNGRGVFNGQAVNASQRGYIPYICSNGSLTSLGATTNYYDRGTALTTGCYSYSGYNSLRLYGYYSSTATSNYAPAYAAMNQLDCSDKDLKSLTISGFYQMAPTAGCALIVGIMDDPADLSTFFMLDSITDGNGLGADKGLYFEVSLKEYTGTGRYIAFRTPTNKTTTIYLDDICVTSAGCPAPKPTISGITDTTAILGSGLQVDNGWTYIITTEPVRLVQLDRGIWPADSIIVKQGTLAQKTGGAAAKRTRVTGLTAETTYYVYMATLCDGSYSAWRQSKFSTLCTPVHVDSWVENFNYEPYGSNIPVPCWTVGNLNAGASSTTIPSVTNSGRRDLGKVLHMYSTMTYTAAYAVSPGLKFPADKSIRDYMICFSGYGTSSATGTTTSATYEHRLKVGIVTDPSDLSTMQIIDTISLPTTTQVNHVLLDKYVEKAGATYYLFFLLQREQLSYARACIDSIFLAPIPNCRFPEDVAVKNISYSTADVSWIGNAANYKVAVSPSPLNERQRAEILNDESECRRLGISLFSASKSSCTVSSLAANTRYYVYVQGICSATEQSEWSYEEVSFRTDCAPYETLPYSENFDRYEKYGTGIQPDCYWGYQSKGNSTSSQTSYGPKYYPHIHNTTGYPEKGHSVYFYSITNTLVKTWCILNTPQIDPSVDLSTVQVSMMVRRGNVQNTYESTLVLGLVPSLEDTASFVPLDTINLVARGVKDINWYSVEFNLNASRYQQAIRRGYHHFALLMPTPEKTAYNNMYVDNFKVRYIPTCFEPKFLTVEKTGLNSVFIRFRPALPSDDEWEARVTDVKTGKEQLVLIHDSIAEVLGLDHSTDYRIDVRTVCGDHDYSEYSDPVLFSTLWEVDTYEWSFTLNEQKTISVPNITGATMPNYAIHPGLHPTARDTVWKVSSAYLYLPYQIANSSTTCYSEGDRFKPANDTARALLFSTSPTYDSATVILPYITSPAGKQLRFDVRSCETYVGDHNTVSYRDHVTGNTYPRATLSIGVVDSICGIETFRKLAEWRPSTQFAGDSLTEQSRFGWDRVLLPLNAWDLRGKQLAFMMAGCGSSKIYVDNLAIEPAGGRTSPYLNGVEVADVTATLHWNRTAAKYTVYVVDTAAVPGLYSRYIPALQDADKHCVRTISNLTDTFYTVSGLTENTTYAFYVEDQTHAGEVGSLSNRRVVTTVCAARSSKGFVYGFEPGEKYVRGASPSASEPDGFVFQWPNSTSATDTTYKTPECWMIGLTAEGYDPMMTTYKKYQPTMNSTYGEPTGSMYGTTYYDVAYEGSYALQFFTTPVYKEAYVVMPLFSDLDYATSEISFYGRCGYANRESQLFVGSQYAKGGNFSTLMAVGTMADPNDFSTFVPLDTVEWDYTIKDFGASTHVESDTTGMRFFRHFTVPLKGAVGDYLCLRQVGAGVFYVDNLGLQPRQTTRPVRDLQIVRVGHNEVDLTWRGMEQGGKYEIEYNTDDQNWDAAQKKVVTTTKATLTGLNESETYYVRVRQIGTVYGASRFCHCESFTTVCDKKNAWEVVTSFEGTDEDPEMANPLFPATLMNRCWTYLNWGKSTSGGTNFPQNVATTSTTSFAHSGTKSLRLYSGGSATNNYEGCVVLPNIAAEVGRVGAGFDTLQLVFWACPVGHYLPGKSSKGTAGNSAASDAKCIEIGTCTDPNNRLTYVPLETWFYEVDGNLLKAGSTADETNDYAFRRVTVKLNKAVGPFVYILAKTDRGDNKAYTTSTMYIDDLQLDLLTNCDAPTDGRATKLTCSTADITWKATAHHYSVEVSTDPQFTDEARLVVRKDGVVGNLMTLSSLYPSTTYYFRVRAFCDEKEMDFSEWMQTANFRTPFAPLYDQTFTSSDFDIDDGWNYYTGYADQIFSGAASLTANTGAASYNTWGQVQNIAFRGYAMRMQLFYTSSTETYLQKYWLVSPGISIERDSAQLVFDAALTYYKASASSDPSSMDVRNYVGWDQGWDDQFMVIISDDDGKTWKRENAVVWNNETSMDSRSEHYRYGPGDYRLLDIPTTGRSYSFPLSKYKGKTIRVAFYAENTKQNCQGAIHIDNFHINYLAYYEQSVELCQYEDVSGTLGFYIDGDHVQPGDTMLERSSLSYIPGKPDSMVILNVHYKAVPESYETISVCEGTPFKYKDFFEHAVPGNYRMKLQSLVSGCDSIVNLTLTHTPGFFTEVDTTLCYGTPFYVGDKAYTEAGFYRDTLHASATYGGCDSIVELNLSYTEELKHELTVQLCAGESYYWADGDTTVSTSGIYRRIYHTLGCDSTTYLYFTSVAPVIVSFDDTIPEGGFYSFGGQNYSKSGTYRFPTQSLVTGCDSTTVLNLYVIPAPIIYTRDTMCDGTGYPFGSQLLRQPGVYRDTTYAATTHYMTITELTLLSKPKSYAELPTVYLMPGESYDFYGRAITETGSYTSNLTAANGCDSVVSINIIVIEKGVGVEEKSVCRADMPYLWKDSIVCESAGSYAVKIPRPGEADSMVVLLLRVNEPVRRTIEGEMCPGGTYVFGGHSLTVPGNYYDTLTALSTGCDSIVTLVLKQLPFDTLAHTEYFCSGDSLYFRGEWLKEAGIYRDTVWNETHDCQYLDLLTLRENFPVSVNLNQTICDGESFVFGEEVLTETCTRILTIPSLITGCDSTTYLSLRVLSTSRQSIPVRVCSGETYVFGGRELTTSGVYYDTLRNSFGCDSVVTLILTVNESHSRLDSAEICAGSSYIFAGRELTKSGLYSDTIIDENHCPAIHSLQLTVRPVLEGYQTAMFCTAYNYRDTIYRIPGDYEVRFQNDWGCDTLVHLHLVQDLNARDTMRITICEGERYEDENFICWNPGKYEAKSFEEDGCVVTHILYLSLHPSELTVDTACNFFHLPYTYGSLTYPEGTPVGEYYDTIQVERRDWEGKSCWQTVYHHVHIGTEVGVILTEEDRNAATRKLIWRGKMYIYRNGRWYNLQGEVVENPFNE